MANEFKKGKCGWCREETTIYRDNKLCEQCDSDTVHCRICDDLVHADDLCRHVFRDKNFEWSGAGVGPHPTDAAKRGLFALLDRMPDGFVGDLRVAIRSGRFYTWFIAPLIGGGGMLELNGMPWGRGCMWGDKIFEIGAGDDNEDCADGYHWLASLYERRTLKANNRTLDAINEWLLAA